MRWITFSITYQMETELPVGAPVDELSEEIEIALVENTAIEIDRVILENV